MAGSNRDEKSSFQTDISQDVIDAALESVDRHVQSPALAREDEVPETITTMSMDLPEGGVSMDMEGPEGVVTMEMEIPEGGVTMEVAIPEGCVTEPEAPAAPNEGGLRAALHDAHRDLKEMRRARDEARELLAQSRRELEEARQQLEFSQSRSRETMDRLKDTHERALRATADLENYRKRAQKEKEEVQKFGSERLLKDFLPVVDNLDRALEAAQKSSDFESLRTGVEMTRKLFDSAFGKHGVKGFSAAGQPFDPRLHEAMQQVESAAVPAGHVLYEAVRGYTLNERLIRPALVVVARAPAAPPPAAEATPSETAPEGGPTGGHTTEQTGTTPSESQ
ncbi:nucleotide exchange factor GrpE [Archangium violaceum]|uniref:Protein GrpE n=1 Tax=Archangium violaceum Cb vi76 TaxID=1406225 RepID=A0A084SFI6_9BACT|nr:nucleotide exchange factor GrpE [Archangium violaceum]KFA87221.1 molecular chaperone GrpE [Archangium violaceum Cb vi76]